MGDLRVFFAFLVSFIGDFKIQKVVLSWICLKKPLKAQKSSLKGLK